ncbi:MAG: transcription elongation factor Spt5 [Methanomassiliicoccales archaeon]
MRQVTASISGGSETVFRLEVPGENSALIPVGGNAEFSIKVVVSGERELKLRVRNKLISSTEGSPEWHVKTYYDGALKWDSYSNLPPESSIKATSGDHWLTIQVEVPPGAAYGDATDLEVELDDGAHREAKSFSIKVRPSILAIKTAIGQEREVADSLSAKAKGGDLGIYSILVPSNIKGYVLIEAMNSDKIENSIRSIRKAHGLVKGETSLGEISHFLTPKPAVSGIVEGDIVELVAGPFKGEKARVQRIDHSKEEITVELFEAVVPIPVTVRGDHVRVISKEKQ